MVAKELYPLEVDPVEQMVSDTTSESFPIDWFVEELMSSPVLAKELLSRFVDANKDGILTSHELLAAGDAAAGRSHNELDLSDRF